MTDSTHHAEGMIVGLPTKMANATTNNTFRFNNTFDQLLAFVLLKFACANRRRATRLTPNRAF